MTETPLYTALMEHRALHRAAFHTPGHKKQPPQPFRTTSYPSILPSCRTPTASLKPKAPSCARSRPPRGFLAQSGRSSPRAGARCVSRRCCAWPRRTGGKILCGRVVHRSAVNAMALLGLEPVWALPEDLVDAVALHPDVRAAYVTSPNYYGELADIPALAAACREQGNPLARGQCPRRAPLLHGARPASDCAGGLHDRLFCAQGRSMS